MKRKGVTLQLLWEEYRAIYPGGYGRTQFFDLYRKNSKTIKPVMRFEHKAGEKLFVDFSGDTPSYVDRETGEVISVELFVAVIGASSRTYALAVASQQIPDWIRAHIGAFEYFSGVPEVIVPDQVNIDYHVAVHGSFYSVPYTLIGKEVEVCLTISTVEVLHDGKRVASHLRTHKKGVYVTVHEHRPHSHKEHLEWTPERMKHWGASIGIQTGIMIESIIKSVVHAEHAYRRCLGLLRLAKKYGNERLELACERALKLRAIDYRSVKNILEKGIERTELPCEQDELQLPLEHTNIRGSGYYAGGAQ